MRRLYTPRTRKEVRIRAPFSVSNEKLVDIDRGTEFQKYARINVYLEETNKQKIHSPILVIGEECYFGNRVSFLVGGEIRIGNHVLVADDVSFVSENHCINPEESSPYMEQELESEPISIGDNCWIGERVTVTAGCNIGNGCVIGAGSVVTKSIPRYSIAVGIPAKVIKSYNFKTHNWERV